MEIRLAKTAGFCFGVKRAVDLTYGLLNEGCKVATLGPLIHNPQVVEDLESKGAITCDSVDDVPDGYEVVIRSHGVSLAVKDALKDAGVPGGGAPPGAGEGWSTGLSRWAVSGQRAALSTPSTGDPGCPRRNGPQGAYCVQREKGNAGNPRQC